VRASSQGGQGLPREWNLTAALLARALVAPAGLALLVGPDREAEARAAIVAGLAPYRAADGGYVLENEFRYLLARLSAAAVGSAVD
jgi:hypothetical protein